MSHRVSFAVIDDRPVARKRAAEPTERSRLEREARLLRLAAGPGVVPLLDARTGEDQLVLGRAVGGPAGDLRPASVDAAGAFVLVVAETVTRLHRAGIAHGRLDASHVLVDGHGRPLLTGFADAVEAAESDPDEWAAATATDVEAIGVFLSELAGRAPTARGDDLTRHAIHRLVDRATFPDRDRRPDIAALAASLRAVFPEAARLPAPVDDPTVGTLGNGDSRPSADPPGAAVHRLRGRGRATSRSGTDGQPSESAGRLRRLAGVCGAAAVATAGGWALLPSAGGPSAQAGGVAPTYRLERTSDQTSAATDGGDGDASPPPAVRLWPAVCPLPEVAADAPCPVRTDGATINVAGATFAGGDADDLAMAADVDCDGTAEPVLVRPSTGAVFVFTGWPDAGNELVAGASHHFPPIVVAVDVVDVDGDGCDELRATFEDAGSQTGTSAWDPGAAR